MSVQLFSRLLLLIAVLLMAVGMTPAAAGTMHHAAASEMPMGHCPDQGSDHRTKSGIAECTMACAAALPALASSIAELPVIHRTQAQSAPPEPLDGLHPETATPPPKSA